MAHWISIGPRNLALLGGGEVSADFRLLAFDDPHAALVFLREVQAEPLGMRTLRDWLDRLPEGARVQGWSDGRLIAHLADLLVQGRLSVAEHRPAERDYLRPAMVVALPEEEERPPEPKQSGREVNLGRRLDRELAKEAEKLKNTVLHWIEIELVGEDDKPIANESFVIVLPSGREVRGKLNAKGFARVDGFPETGTCKVSFPDLDGQGWSFIETV